MKKKFFLLAFFIVLGTTSLGVLGKENNESELPSPVEEFIHIIPGGHALTKSGRLFLWPGFKTTITGETHDSGFPIEFKEYKDLLDFSEGEEIIKVDRRGFLTSEGRVFVWGGDLPDDPNIPLLTENIREITSWGALSTLEADDKIVFISFSYGHSFLVSEKNRLFVWGPNAKGQIGDGTYQDADSPIEIFVSLGEGEEIIDVFPQTTGTRSRGRSYLLTSNGRVFIWGILYRWDVETHGIYPTDVTETGDFSLLSADDKIIQISVGEFSSIALSEKGRVFTWGIAIEGRGGFENPPSHETSMNVHPKEITKNGHFKYLSEDDKIVKVAMDSSVGIALSSTGRIFVWGRSDLGLGDGREEGIRWTPYEITEKGDFENLHYNDKIIDVFLSRNGFLYLSEENRLFAVGLERRNNRLLTGRIEEGEIGRLATVAEEVKVIEDTFLGNDFKEQEVLPAAEKLLVFWKEISPGIFSVFENHIKTNGGENVFLGVEIENGETSLNIFPNLETSRKLSYFETTDNIYSWGQQCGEENNDTCGTYQYSIIDTSRLSLDERKISYVSDWTNEVNIQWLVLEQSERNVVFFSEDGTFLSETTVLNGEKINIENVFSENDLKDAHWYTLPNFEETNRWNFDEGIVLDNFALYTRFLEQPENSPVDSDETENLTSNNSIPCFIPLTLFLLFGLNVFVFFLETKFKNHALATAVALITGLGFCYYSEYFLFVTLIFVVGFSFYHYILKKN